jgi:hypothetical protein
MLLDAFGYCGLFAWRLASVRRSETVSKPELIPGVTLPALFKTPQAPSHR